MFCWLVFFEKLTVGCDLGGRYAPEKTEILNFFLKKKCFFVDFFLKSLLQDAISGSVTLPKKLEILNFFYRKIIVFEISTATLSRV